MINPVHRKGVFATSPLWNRKAIEGATVLRELAWRGKINLRGDPDDAKFLKAAANVLGAPLPLESGGTSAHDEMLIFWLGPNEWLVHCAQKQTQTLLATLAEKLAPFHHAATDVSDYYAVIELAGDDAADILARGCPLDLHARTFKAAQFAQTRFGNASIGLYKPDAESAFHIHVRWSFAEYVWDYLAQVIDTIERV